MPVSPTATTSTARARPDLQGMFEEFDLDFNNQGMIGLQVMPVFEASMQAGAFGKITLESLMKSVDTKRASGSGYNETDFEFEDDTYATKEHGIKVPVDRRNRRIYASSFDAELTAAKLARSKVMQNFEQRVAALVFDAATYTPTSPTNEWDDAANATPITDVEGRVQALYDAGVIANALVISWKVFRNLRLCTQIKDAIASSGAGDPSKPTDITTAMLAQVFDLPKIIVGRGLKNTAKEGQTASLSPIWSGEYAAVMRVCEPNDPLESVCFGRTFHWSDDGSSIDVTIEDYEDTDKRADIIRARQETHEKVMYSSAIKLLDNITT